MDNLQFSSALREILTSRGISQRWLATEAKTTEATISRYIYGRNQPEISIVANIAQALNVSMDYLCGLSDSPTPKDALSEEMNLLMRNYYRADARDKHTIWTVLERYMSPAEREIATALKTPENQV